MLLTLCPLSVLAKSSLEVQLKKSTGELGRPVYLKIIGKDLNSDLSMLSLQSLNVQFVVGSKDLETEILQQSDADSNQFGNAPIHQQTLSLKLNPRQTGELLIPPFSIDKISSAEKRVTIRDATTDGEKISVDWKLTATEAWQREQIIVLLTLTTPEQYATVKLAQETVDGFEVTALPVKRVWNENKHTNRSIITAGWSLIPLKPGSMAVDLPAIEYHLSGVIRRVFYLPKIKLKIHPLASYLPPTIPVGRIQVKTSVAPTGILNTNELAYWNIHLESQSLTPYWLPSILRQINSNDSIHFFPATSQRSVHPDNKGVHGRVTHTIPFKPLQNGFLDLPELKIQYFDPASGRLETIVHRAEQPFSASMQIRFLIILILSILLVYLLTRTYRYIGARLQYKKQHQLAVDKIRHANTIDDAIAGLRMIGKAEGWSTNLTIYKWLELWQQRYQVDDKLETCTRSLSDIYYGNSEQHNLKNLIHELAELVTKPRRIATRFRLD